MPRQGQSQVPRVTKVTKLQSASDLVIRYPALPESMLSTQSPVSASFSCYDKTLATYRIKGKGYTVRHGGSVKEVVTCPVRRQRVTHFYPASLLIFILSETQELISHTLMVGFPISTNLIQIIPHRCPVGLSPRWPQTHQDDSQL